MLVEREKLEKALKMTINDNNTKKIIKAISKKFSDKGLYPAEANNIFASRTPLESLSLTVLCIFTLIMYEEISEEKINPNKFFTELEIKTARDAKFSKDTDNKYPIIFENVKQLNTDQWYTDLTAQQLVDLYSRRVVIYNPETQRQMKTKVYRDKIISEISINKKSVREIKEYLLNNSFISNFITFNLLQNGEDSYTLNEYGTLTIESGELDVIDGWHRSVSIIDAMQENPDLDFRIGVIITNFDVEKAQKYIVQEDKRNKINKKYIKSLNSDNKSNIIVKKINENSKSHLKGKITTNKHQIKSGEALIMFDTLSDSIDLLFNIKDNMDTVKIGKHIIDGLNVITEEKMELLEKPVDERLWIFYILCLSELYGGKQWEEELIERINSIDEDTILSVQYSGVNKSYITRLKKEVMINV